jgi:hypothetical protein
VLPHAQSAVPTALGTASVTVYHAVDVCVRELPITLDKLLV